MVAIVVFSVLWILMTGLLNRYFPWFVALLGPLLGLAVRRAGRGIDWRFPILAAVFAFTGAHAAHAAVAASTTAQLFDADTFLILRNATRLTWPLFFDEVVGVADWLFAFIAAGLAAFYSQRRLSRTEYYSLRLWQQEQADG